MAEKIQTRTSDTILRPGTIDDVDTIHAALLRFGAHTGGHQQITSTAEDFRRIFSEAL